MNHSFALITGKAVLGGSLALGLLLAPHGVAHADEVDAQLGTDGTVYVNLSDLPGIDSMPMCLTEDGSGGDPSQLPCIWLSKAGDSWLTYADRSYLIVDDMVR